MSHIKYFTNRTFDILKNFWMFSLFFQDFTSVCLTRSTTFHCYIFYSCFAKEAVDTEISFAFRMAKKASKVFHKYLIRILIFFPAPTIKSVSSTNNCMLIFNLSAVFYEYMSFKFKLKLLWDINFHFELSLS